MNIFNKVALQGLIKNPTRTIVTIIGVILSAAMITAVATFAVSLQDYMIRGSIAKNGNWHVSFSDVDSSFVQKQKADSRASRTAEFENIGYAVLKGGQNPGKPYLFIAGFNKDTYKTLPVNLISGRLPKNSGEVVVSAHVASNGGVRFSEGDTISLTVGNRMKENKRLNQHDPCELRGDEETPQETFVPKEERSYKVVGICTRPVFEERTAPGYTLITAAPKENATGTDGAGTSGSFSTFTSLKDPRQVRDYAEAEGGERDYMFNDDVLRFMGLSSDKIFNTLLYSVGAVLIALVMLGSVFLIYNSFTISLSERMRQMGILLSVGATGKQLLHSVLFEGLCIGLVGIPIGILVGIPCIKFVLLLTAENFGNIMYDNVPLTLSISVPAIAAAAVISMITILISAYIPASRACRTPVMECIRQTNEVKITSRSLKTSRLTERLYGLEGTLAAKNFKRNKKRYRSIVLSLTLSVVLFVSASAFGTTLKQITNQTKVVTDYDISFNAENLSDPGMLELYDKVKAAKGITRSSYQACMDFSCQVPAAQLSNAYWEIVGKQPEKKGEKNGKGEKVSKGENATLSLSIQFLDQPSYEKIAADLKLPAEEGRLIGVAKMADQTGEAEGVHQLLDMMKSSEASLTFLPQKDAKQDAVLAGKGQGKTLDISCGEFVPPDTPISKNIAEDLPYYFMAVAPWSLKEDLESYGNLRVKGCTFESSNAALSTKEINTIIESLGIALKSPVYNVHGMLEENRNLLFIVNLFTLVFVIMISLIATVNVFNTISTNIKLRRRELAMLRSVGMPDQSFNKMMRFECALYGIRTLLLGLPLAGILSWLIFKALTVMEEVEFPFEFPWLSMGISTLGVFLIIFITMVYAVRKIKKENIIDSLRDEMT
ncbi:MAG: ABC transporter permease [Firmicutes bacterium]|nr:ABC transporter permease [Bacillota bacterium]